MHSLYQQNSSKDCGGAALLMVFTDLMRNDSSLGLIDSAFLTWVSRSYQTEAQEIIAQAKKHQLNFHSEKLRNKTALETIQKHIRSMDLPVIVSITHPIICGHWIVVDGIENGFVFIRDTHSGEAYCIPSKDFLSFLDEDIEQCIYKSS